MNENNLFHNVTESGVEAALNAAHKSFNLVIVGGDTEAKRKVTFFYIAIVYVRVSVHCAF